MQKVATKPHARPMPHGQAASFSIYGSILYKNRQALPVRDTGHGNDLHTASFIPYYYLYYETIVRLSREKGVLQDHFMQKKTGRHPLRSTVPVLFYSRYILRRRIRRAGVRPYSASR